MSACRSCGKDYLPLRPLQAVCSVQCAKRLVRTKRKAERAHDRQRKEALRTKSEWAQLAQQAFNAWVRARDAGDPCISCGATSGKMNAGHYLSRGARPELRFDEDNAHLQCERCNTYLSGNAIAYRSGLIRKIGEARVLRLEGPHPLQKWTVDELRDIQERYKAQARALHSPLMQGSAQVGHGR